MLLYTPFAFLRVLAVFYRRINFRDRIASGEKPAASRLYQLFTLPSYSPASYEAVTPASSFIRDPREPLQFIR